MWLNEENVAHFVFTTIIMKLLWTVVRNTEGKFEIIGIEFVSR